MEFFRDLRDSSTQAQLVQLVTSIVSIILIVRRFQKANQRVRDLRYARSEIQ